MVAGNIQLGEPMGSLTAATIAEVIFFAVKGALGKTVPGLVATFFLAVAKTILNGDVSYGSEDAYLSFEIKKRNVNRSPQI